MRRGKRANIVVVFPAQVDGGDVHPAVVGPVVGERDHQFDAQLLGGPDHLVEGLKPSSTVVWGQESASRGRSGDRGSSGAY